MGNRQQFESVLLQIMFNFQFYIFVFDLFVSINYSFLFLVFFVYSFTSIYNSRTNLLLFLNIFNFLLGSTIFVFNCNLGPYAGFLFLCETISLFTIFVIVGRTYNYDYSYVIYKQKTLLVYTMLVQILLFALLAVFRLKVGFYNFNYYQFDALTTNDFLTTFYLLYTNNYQVFSLISVMLIIVTLLIAISVINHLLYKSYSTYNFSNYKPLLDAYLMSNNSINTRTLNLLNFFKKACLILILFRN